MVPHFNADFHWHGQEGHKGEGLIQKSKWAVALSSFLQSGFVCIGLSGPNHSACKLQMFYPKAKLPRQNTTVNVLKFRTL